MYQEREKIVFLEDEGLAVPSKTGNEEDKRQPPKLRRSLKNLDYLAESGLNFLIPGKTQPSSSSSLYSESSDYSFLEQCFSILDRIGNGSFGHVLKVFSRLDKKFYALKLAKRPFRGEQDRALRLMEVSNHSLLSGHPNIVTLHDAWEEDRLLYMLMELCKHSMANHKMSEDQCWEILADMSSALDLMHSNGLGHFDVKLENILEGYDGLYKLADFGLTFKINNPALKHPLEGDAKYLAPELLTAATNFSEKADIYSLGISVLELAGNLNLPSHGEVWSALRQNKFPKAQTMHLSDELLVLLTQMMARDPAERPTTKQLLAIPRIKDLVEQRSSMANQRLAFPTDELHLTVLASTVMYTMICEAVKHLMLNEPSCETTDEPMTENEDRNQFQVPSLFPKNKIYTSTPRAFETPTQGRQSAGRSCSGYSSWPTYSSGPMNSSEPMDSSGTMYSSGIGMTPSSSSRPSTSGSSYGSNRQYISPAVMSRSISPIKMSRDIKVALKERLSRKRKSASVARKLTFEEDEDEDYEIPEFISSGNNNQKDDDSTNPSKRKRGSAMDSVDNESDISH